MKTLKELSANLTPPYTLLLLKDGEIVERDERRGVLPLLERYEAGKRYSSFVALDRAVGKAAAFLYVAFGIAGVYAARMSEGGAEVLSRYGVPFEAGERVEVLRNRDGSDLCPMERATARANTPEEGIAAIRARIGERKGEREG